MKLPRELTEKLLGMADRIDGRPVKAGSLATPVLKPLAASITEKAWMWTVINHARAFGWMEYHTFDSRKSRRGFPDLVLVRERLLFAELKREGEDLEPDQVTWRDLLIAAGQAWYLWRPGDWATVKDILEA